MGAGKGHGEGPWKRRAGRRPAPFDYEWVCADYQLVVLTSLPQPPLPAGVQDRTSPEPEWVMTNEWLAAPVVAFDTAVTT